jgi:hypothetical protein
MVYTLLKYGKNNFWLVAKYKANEVLKTAKNAFRKYVRVTGVHLSIHVPFGNQII